MEDLGMTMAFSSLFRKASNLLGLGSPDNVKPVPLDGEIIYCKNNVCVHPPAALSTDTEHYPGYLNIRSQDDQVLGSTLILTWIPNSSLHKNPRSVENSPAHPKISPRRSPRQEYAKSDQTSLSEPSSQESPESGHSSPEAHYDTKLDVSGVDKEGSQGTTQVTIHSVPSQDDSGIMSGSSVKSECEERNNSRDLSDLPKVVGVGQNVNTIHKEVNVKDVNTDRAARTVSSTSSLSSESDISSSTDAQLNAMLRSKVKHPSTENIKERERRRTSSGLSVTSIEMEGENLVVVTEETGDDSTFLEDDEMNDSITTMVCNHGDVPCKCNHGSTSHQDVDRLLVKEKTDNNSVSSDSTQSSPCIQRYQRMTQELLDQSQARNAADSDKINLPVRSDGGYNTEDVSELGKLKESLDLRLDLNPTHLIAPDISITRSRSRSQSSSCSSTPTSGPDSCPPSPVTPPMYPSNNPFSPLSPSPDSELLSNHCISPPGYNIYNNMSFPENSVNFDAVCTPGGTPANGRSAKDQLCGVFSVDLGQMRSLRVFYSDDKCSSGQLVIASRESQYKILHFHHGGLDRLADTFSDWKFLAQPVKRQNDLDLHCRHFSVIRPHLSMGQIHPEEGVHEVVNRETWNQHMNESGQIEDDFQLRKAIFFAGLEPALRHEMWPFLLHYYPYNSTFETREQIRNDKYIEYQNIRKQRESLSGEELTLFTRKVQSIVEKDVVRTDRSHPYFKGEDNPNLDTLKNILLNYAVAHPHYGYTQGMSDLLSPILVEVQNEVDSYWCFVGLMQKTIFVSSPKDIDMDKQLIYLLALLELMLPDFYNHLCKVQDGKELLFCHRWILLCFKREFPEVDALRMWEGCWAHYQTDYFHLFVCVAIISLYGEDVLEQDLPADEMLLHFSSLSMHMNGNVVLKKARGLLHQFRTLPKIPCTLEGLCTLCGPGMWDSGHVPTIQCVGNHDDDLCPYGGKIQPNLS